MCKSSVPLNAFRLKEDCKGINSLGIKVVRFWKGWGPNFISYEFSFQSFELLGKELCNEFDEQKLV